MENGKPGKPRLSLEAKRPPHNKPAGKKKKTGASSRKVDALLANPKVVLGIAIALLLVLLGVLLAALFSGNTGRETVSSGMSARETSGGGAQASRSDEAPPDVPVPTVLPETADAGAIYAEETLFLGDSNTERMLYYADVTHVTVNNGFGVVGMGISGFSTQGCARFKGVDGTLSMPAVAALLQPRRVVMTFGSNNVGMQVDKFIADYEKAVAQVKSACPYSDIIVGAVFPVDRYRQNTSLNMDRIAKMNEALATMCDALGIKFLNWSEAMYDEEIGYSKFEHTIQDGVHLSRAGMEAIFTYFRTHSFITKDRRPDPAKTLRERIATQPETIRQDGQKRAGPVDWEKVEAAKAPVTVVFSAWDETGGVSGGGSVSPGSVSVKPGGTSGAVTASAKEGYVFVGWSFSSGASGGGGATTSITVDSAATPGSTVSVTAVFRQNQGVSTSSSVSVSVSVSSQSQASVPPDPIPSDPILPDPILPDPISSAPIPPDPAVGSSAGEVPPAP